MSDSPIPVRALNQVTYCQRLYYLQYVDCVMPTNEHVEAGLHDHRRVDDPALAERTRKEGDTLRTRSVALSSERLGISGVLDQVEEKNGEEYPVETKHGFAPRDENGEPTTWDNDAVQLCAQAMLLEESTGTAVRRGFQFYAATKERVEVAFTPELRGKTLDAIVACRMLSAQNSPPEPLPSELRHRCFGCSLAPVCLPEETLFQLTRPAEPLKATPVGLTRVIPESDDGAILYVQEPGSSVGKRGEHLIVKKDGKEMTRVPMHAVRQVVVFGNVQVSTQALQTLLENGLGVCVLTGYGKFIGSFQPAPAKNVGLRETQYQRFADAAECLMLAKAAVRAKLANQRTLLMRSLRSGDDRGSDEPAAQGLADLIRKVNDVGSVESLLGMEGQGAALYFGEFNRFLLQFGRDQTVTERATPSASQIDASRTESKRQRGFDFTSRNRRPPKDPVNALLSFAYSLLTRDCFSAVCTVGFDPYKGFFHVNRHGKPSLALDLMEEFRPVIADSVVLTLLNNEMLSRGDFMSWKDGCQLTDSGRKVFFAAYEQRKATVVTHPVYGYRMSYSRMLEVQARMLAAYVRGTVPAYTGFTVR